MSRDDLMAMAILPGKPLEGRPLEAHWDSGLREILQQRGRALHEEQLIETLLGDMVLA